MERINALLAALGNPHQKIPFIHVAGTNGKGSTSLMISAIIASAGYRVGRFTSPHLHSYFERFTVNGEEIEGRDFNRYLDIIEECIQNLLTQGVEHPTEFEVLTAAAFQYFADQQVDIAVMETGLGGRFDSTNVIIPLVSVITSIDYDHTAVLGTTLKQIADNKAGIIKNKVPLVLGPVPEEAYSVLTDYAADLQAPIIPSSRTRIASREQNLTGQEVDIQIDGHHLEKIWFSLSGAYQLENLSCAVTAAFALKQQGWNIDDQHVSFALSNVNHPGRLEMVSRQPLVLMDAAHNPHAARSLSRSLQELLPGKSRVLVCGMVDDKDARNTLRYLGNYTRHCVVTRPQGDRGSNWYRLYQTWQELHPDIPVQAVENIGEAVQTGLGLLKDQDYLLVTGSFYVLDRARRIFTDD